MNRAVAIFAVLFFPALAQASTISLLGGGVIIPMLPNTAGQTATFLISGTDSYVAADVQMTINDGIGSAPFITHVFNDTDAVIPGANLVGSVWVSGSAGIVGFPNGTAPTSSGLTTGAGFQSAGAASITSEGVFLTFTFSTVGVVPNAFLYPLSFAGTVLNNGLDPETFEPIVVPFDAPTFYIGFIPEPSTYVMAAMGIVGLLLARRRTF